MTSPEEDAKRRARRVIVGLAISGVTLVGFIVWTVFIGPRGEPPAFDWDTARAMQEFTESHSMARLFFVWATFFGSVPLLTCVAAAGVLTSWALKQRVLALGWLMAAGGGGLLDYGLKVSFDRARPPADMRDPAVTETNESYPSGHSMGAIIGFGMVGYVGWRALRAAGLRTLLVVTLAIVVFLIGFSRVVLRAHWLSDVIGGFVIGGSWLALWLSATRWMLGRAAQAKTPGG